MRYSASLLNRSLLLVPPCGGGLGWGVGESVKLGLRRGLASTSEAHLPPPLSPPRKGEGDQTAHIETNT
jgi:hypothetical protein